MEIDLEDVGKRIYYIRKKHNYSMAAFAKLIGNSSASTVNNWEKGNNLPKQDRLEKIALLGNKTVNWILFGEFDTYVSQLLRTGSLNRMLSTNQLQKLIKKLEKNKITYKNDLAILTTAKSLFPELFNTDYHSLPSNLSIQLVSEEITNYSIEQDKEYRSDILPKIEELLAGSNDKNSNRQILFTLLNLIEYSSFYDQSDLVSEIILLITKMIQQKPILISITEDMQNEEYFLMKQSLQLNYQTNKDKMNKLLDKFYLSNNR